LRRFAEIDGHSRVLLLEAAFCIVLARLALIFIPFPRLARHLGRFVTPDEAKRRGAQALGREADARHAGEIGWAVTRAARNLPFKAVCLPQAIAARLMLDRRRIASVLHFGAAKGSDEQLDAHAWLDAAGVEVTGYPTTAFTEIACFV
jgi:hypothetical protein